MPSTLRLARTSRSTSLARRSFVLSTRIWPPDWPIADQRVAPDATTLRASETATSAVRRVAWTTSASGIEYGAEGLGVAGVALTLGEVGLAGSEEPPAVGRGLRVAARRLAAGEQSHGQSSRSGSRPHSASVGAC